MQKESPAGELGSLGSRCVRDRSIGWDGEIAAYVTSTDRSWPFSFENLCDAVGLEPGALRKGLQNTLHRPDADPSRLRSVLR